MFHVRSSTEGSQESISAILTVIWQIVSNVNGIIFKDLKQTLKKEQCEVKKKKFLFQVQLNFYVII
jgi:hypothetical protein